MTRITLPGSVSPETYRAKHMPWLFWLGFCVAVAIYVVGLALALVQGLAPIPFGLFWGSLLLGIGYLEGWKKAYRVAAIGDSVEWSAPFRSLRLDRRDVRQVVTTKGGRGSALVTSAGQRLHVSTPDHESREAFLVFADGLEEQVV